MLIISIGFVAILLSPTNITVAETTTTSVLLKWSAGTMVSRPEHLIYKLEYSRSYSRYDCWNVSVYNRSTIGSITTMVIVVIKFLFIEQVQLVQLIIADEIEENRKIS